MSVPIVALAGCGTREEPPAPPTPPAPPRTDDPDTDGEIVDIRDFGAEVDGTTDDTAAVREAIGSVEADGFVYFPPGTTLVSADDPTEERATAVEIFGNDFPDNVTFFGEGDESVVRLAGGHTTNHGLFAWRPEDGINGHVVRDLKFDGNRDGQPADPDSDDNGLNLAVTDAAHDDVTVDVHFENVRSVDANTECFTLLQGGCSAARCTASGAGKHGFGIDSEGKTGPVLPPITVRHSYASDCQFYGIDCSGGNILVEDSVFENNGWGTKTTDEAFDITYRRVRLAGNRAQGYQRNDTPTEDDLRATVTFEHVIAERNGHQGFRFGRGTDYTIGRIVARANNSTGRAPGNIAIMDDARLTADVIHAYDAVNGVGIYYGSSAESSIDRYVNTGNIDGALGGRVERLEILDEQTGTSDKVVDIMFQRVVPYPDGVGVGTGALSPN